ncbi:MAG: porin, partial [Paracoccus sp. (in: a-proteobacteria)]|nr:porin [Paracoccus sp. (in: a-proteobacteria)]
MKKALFATTALVMTAGVAAAEVSVTGDARMGMRYESNTAYGA